MMKKGSFLVILIMLFTLGCLSEVLAHFGTLIPSDDVITQDDPKKITLELKFIHPMENIYMEMAKPKKVGIFFEDQVQDITPNIVPKKGKGKGQDKDFTYWVAEYSFKKPGDYIFFMEPEPYWEPAEDKFIIHYTKVVVNFLGKEKGWDTPLNLPIEIVPLTRPYGLWTGNVFQGQVLVGGKPAPNIEVEVEYLNPSQDIEISADAFVTQVIKTDPNGIFTYAIPKAGWWGFAALTEAPEKIKHNGEDKDVEIGGVLWVHAVDMKEAKRQSKK